MNIHNKAYLPLWTSDFAEIRTSGSLYVDKTDLICSLAEERGVIFFARPRRFGKSLLVSTLETLFRDGMTNFEGLKIDGKWNDTIYKVLKLDFSYAKDVDSKEKFLNKCWLAFRDGCVQGEIEFESQEGDDLGKMLSSILFNLNKKKIVLLIDEYDAPLTANLNNTDLFESIRSELSNFYSIIKSNNKFFRLVFLTGIAKFNQASIFSSLNNLIDISLKREYGEMLGYTEEEVRSYFGDYISEAATVRGVTQEKMLEDLREQYDGFCFDEEASTHVYAPWSVLNFFKSTTKELDNFWYRSSGRPSVLLQYLKNQENFDIFSYNKFDSSILSLADLIEPRDIHTLKDAVLLVQTGYLTIKESKKTSVVVGYPNKEVASSMATLAIECMMGGKTESEAGIIDLKGQFLANDPSEVVKVFNSAFLNIPYQRYPVTDESACRALILMLLRGAQIFSFAEVSNSNGRSDLEVFVGDSHWVFEFKFVPDGEPQERKEQNVRGSLTATASVSGKDEEARPVVQKEVAKLAEALEQIRDRRYGEGCPARGNLLRVALVFSQKDKRFVEWETYPLSKRADASARNGWAQALASELRKKGWGEAMLAPLQEEAVETGAPNSGDR